MLAVPIRELAMRHAEQLRRGAAGGTRLAEGLRASRRIAFYAAMKVRRRLMGSSLYVFHYDDAAMFFVRDLQPKANSYPVVIPDWDNSPRSGARAVILHGSTPESFRRHIEEVIGLVEHREPEDRIVFVKSWNEWAEGNYLEPDRRFGHQYLDVVRETVLAAKRL